MAEVTVNGAVHNVQPGDYIANVVLRTSDGSPVLTSPDATFTVPGGGGTPVADAPSVGVS